MVCLGNICRSPIAEGILRSKVDELGLDWVVDSAGTSGYHKGELPDKRSIEEAANNGIDISNQRSRVFTTSDFKEFDLILAMDQSNYNKIKSLSENESDRNKVRMILDYTFPGENIGVPDPYYEEGFDEVFELLDAAIDHMIELYTELA